jgi:SAM-dependent methyltransferase
VTPTSDRYFEQQWDATDDPWDQVGRFSEQRKYDLTVASLPLLRYRRAFEPGCATGSLTARIAARVETVLAWDRHPRAVAATAQRCASLANVTVELGQLPTWPDGPFDLVVLSEILYYFDLEAIDDIVGQAWDHLEPGGHLVACHYRPFVAEHAVGGDEVHERLHDGRWRRPVEHHEADFVLEVFERP